MSESLRLGGDAACDFLDIAGDIGEFDPEPADLIGKLIDQTLKLTSDLLFPNARELVQSL